MQFIFKLVNNEKQVSQASVEFAFSVLAFAQVVSGLRACSGLQNCLQQLVVIINNVLYQVWRSALSIAGGFA